MTDLADSTTLYLPITQSSLLTAFCDTAPCPKLKTAPWYAPLKTAILFLPVNTLAALKACMLASVPELANRTRSKLNRSHMRAAYLCSWLVVDPRFKPTLSKVETMASRITGCEWP